MSVNSPVIFCQTCIITALNPMDARHMVGTRNLTCWIQHTGPPQSFCTDLHMYPKSPSKTVHTHRMDRSVT